MHFDQDLAAAWRRIRHVFVSKNFGTSVFVKNDCFHVWRLVYPTLMSDEKNVRTIAVIGAGIMGSGIAHVAALGGFNTILNDVSEELLGKARDRIRLDIKKVSNWGRFKVVLRIIEIVRGLKTSDETFKLAEFVSRTMGKETVEVKESPGFVTSRMNALIGNEAFYMLHEGVSSARDIDKALKLGLNHPMGPFEMIDLVGLDTRLSILSFLHRTLGEKYRPCPLLVEYVQAGRLGKKVGKGVYEY